MILYSTNLINSNRIEDAVRAIHKEFNLDKVGEEK